MCLSLVWPSGLNVRGKLSSARPAEMKECEASASAQELAAMQRQHSEYLRIWSGLKLALETEEKRAAIDMRPATGRA